MEQAGAGALALPRGEDVIGRLDEIVADAFRRLGVLAHNGRIAAEIAQRQ